MHKCNCYHKPRKQKFPISPTLDQKERKPAYHFLLLNNDMPVGCLKGYNDNEGKEVVIYVCGMKNTFRIESYISKEEMLDFLHLASHPIFDVTYFGATLKMPGFPEPRQQFCVVENIASNLLTHTSVRQEYDRLLEENDNILDIYPDKYDEDNTKPDPSLGKDLEEPKEEEGDEIDKLSYKPDVFNESNHKHDCGRDNFDHKERHHRHEDHLLHEKERACHKENESYQPLIRLSIEDKEFGLLMDMEITGYFDASAPIPKPKHHHDKYHREFDETPDDDYIQKDRPRDGIDHVIMDKYLS